MEGVPWSLLYVFTKQGFVFLQDHDSLPSQLWQLSSSSLPSCTPYLALLCNSGLHFDASLIQGPALLFPVGLSNCIFPWWVIHPINLPHKFHFNINVLLIFKLYLFIWFSQFLNFMADFVQVSLETVFYEVSVLSLTHILLGLNYLPLVPLNYLILFF